MSVAAATVATSPSAGRTLSERSGPMTVTPDHLAAASASVAAALEPTVDRPWDGAAGTGDRDAWHTAEHLGDTLLSFAAQVLARPDDRFVRFMAVADQDATSAEVLEMAVTGAGILTAVLRTAGPGVRAFHPAGVADAEGFAAMGCVEVLLHGEDIARGLGTAVEPPAEVCARVLARLFPHVADQVADVEPWDALRWATHRLELPGLVSQAAWQWRAAPTRTSARPGEERQRA
jgi:hypothetical protein